MTMELFFWILMLLWLVLGLYNNYTPGQPYPFRVAGWNLLQFVLFGLLGWKVFGPPIR